MATLRVEFVGLCMYVPLTDSDAEKTGSSGSSTDFPELLIAMPDARLKTPPPNDPNGAPPPEPHAGYIKLDIRNVGGLSSGVDLPPSADGGEFEFVYQFRNEELSFSGLADGPISTSIGLPDLSDFATLIQPAPDLITGTPPELLMRTRIQGGTITSQGKDPSTWWLDTLLSGTPDQPIVRNFDSYTVWETDIVDDYVELAIGPIGGSPTTRLRLSAGDQDTIDIKIANLCCENPLEWQHLNPRQPLTPVDDDFRWLYHLTTPREGSWTDLLAKLNTKVLPVPVRGEFAATGRVPGTNIIAPFDNCFGMTFSEGMTRPTQS